MEKKNKQNGFMNNQNGVYWDILLMYMYKFLDLLIVEIHLDLVKEEYLYIPNVWLQCHFTSVHLV